MNFELLFFYFFGLLACASGLLFITRKSPVAAALWLVHTMFSLAALYVLLDAQFVGAIQVLVYAGAIMVVFLFVVMLLNLGHVDAVTDLRQNRTRLLAGVMALLLLAELAVLAQARFDFGDPLPITDAERTNVVTSVAQSLFTDQLVAFELTSVLLLVAIIGSVILAKRSRTAGTALQAAEDDA
jgi:NADH-quinone oxidoreductase subunit J